MAVTTTMTVAFSSNADRTLALRKLQRIVDGNVAPLLTTRALEVGANGSVGFDEVIPAEQVIACYQGAVNMAGTTESGYSGGTVALSGTVSSGSRQRNYSV